MIAEDIQRIIAEELKSEPDVKNVFGLDLTQCLIYPTKQNYIDSFDDSQTDVLWTVLEETADSNGYKIYFDEDINMFGLGIKSANGELMNIGYYGTFLKTLYSM